MMEFLDCTGDIVPLGMGDLGFIDAALKERRGGPPVCSARRLLREEGKKRCYSATIKNVTKMSLKCGNCYDSV